MRQLIKRSCFVLLLSALAGNIWWCGRIRGDDVWAAQARCVRLPTSASCCCRTAVSSESRMMDLSMATCSSFSASCSLQDSSWCVTAARGPVSRTSATTCLQETCPCSCICAGRLLLLVMVAVRLLVLCGVIVGTHTPSVQGLLHR